ncbi:MAG: DUF11 domain-containing protein [Granulosicoccus sp.]|nr:DUF11 domain-containing protein [Granulosicoccus sp.]
MHYPRFLLVLSVLFSMAGLAFASGPVTGEIQAFIVSVDEDGKEVILQADEAEPGNVMEFRIVFTNNGDDDVRGVQVVDPIPQNTRFVPDSPQSDVPADFEVSIDGGESFELEPVVRIETQADGSQKEVVIPPEQYTHVRWLAQQELTSNGGQHQFTYRVTVD